MIPFGVFVLIFPAIGIGRLIVFLKIREPGDPFLAPIFFVCLVTTVIFYFGVRFIGTGMHKPVTLRVDKDGISGYQLPPARRRDIAAVESYSDSEGTNYIGFKLDYRNRAIGGVFPGQHLSHTGGILITDFDLLIPVAIIEQDRILALARTQLRTRK